MKKIDETGKNAYIFLLSENRSNIWFRNNLSWLFDCIVLNRLKYQATAFYHFF